MSKRIVIVDDTVSIGRFIKTAIEATFDGLDVMVVPSGEEALLEAGIGSVDLIIADINLPGISGVDLSKRFKARFPISHVILMTAMDQFPLQAKAEEVGASGYFLKPLDSDALMQTVGRCLSIAGKSLAPSEAHVESDSDERAEPDKGTTPIQNEPEEESLTVMIAGLRQRLEADSAILMDERGRIVAQAGDLADTDFETNWGVPITGLTSSSARLSRLVGEVTPQSLLFFRGETNRVIVAPIGTFAMVLFLKRGETTTLRTAAVIEEIHSSQREISEILKGMGVQLQMVKPSQVVSTDKLDIEDTDLPPGQLDEETTASFTTSDLENLLQKVDEVASEEADEYWGNLVKNSAGSLPVDPDVLTYDEAVQLGLTPEDE